MMKHWNLEVHDYMELGFNKLQWCLLLMFLLILIFQNCSGNIEEMKESNQKSYFVFVALGPSGNVGGFSANNGKKGFDSGCMSSRKIEDTNNYKALIGVDNFSDLKNTRIYGLKSQDSPLIPNTKYLRLSDKALIGTTNSEGTFNFPLLNSFGTVSSGVWTGINTTATFNDWYVGDNCNAWNNNTGVTQENMTQWNSIGSSIGNLIENSLGIVGEATSLSMEAINKTKSSCNINQGLICVQVQ